MKWSPLLIQCVVFVLFFEEMSTTNNVYENTKVYRIVISINNHFLKAVQKGNGKTNSITENSLYDNRNIRKKQLLLNLFHFFSLSSSLHFSIIFLIMYHFDSFDHFLLPDTHTNLDLHLDSTTTPQEQTKKRKRSKNFICSICQKCFYDNSHLKDHIVFLFPPHFTQFLFLDHSHKRKGFSVLYLQQAILKSFFSQGSYQIS